jgi:hypothetical protein
MMQDQLQEAVRITQAKIAALESEIRREREFLGRLLPDQTPAPRKHSNTQVWVGVLKALASKPMRHEHIIDYIEEHQLPLSRGATRVWLGSRKHNGHIKQDKDGFYSVAPPGLAYIKKATQ